MSAPRTRVQPMDFRKDEVDYIMTRWRANESCSLVGVGSIGKSNLLQHLSNPETQKHFLGDVVAENFHTLIIDPNLLGPLPSSGDIESFRCWAGHELIMHRLYVTFYPFKMLSEEDARYFYDIYQAMHDGSNSLYAYMGVRYLEIALDILFRNGIKIVFMFDEFEDMLKNLPVKFFQTLRGLRDSNKKHLSYLTFTRAPLPILVDRYGIDMLAIEPFTELFTDNLRYIGPYNENDARRMIKDLMARNNKPYDDMMTKFLIWASGGFAGLIRSAFREIDILGEINVTSMINDEAVQKLAHRRPVREECRTIWTSLTPPEQHFLKAAANLTKLNSGPEAKQAIPMLTQKKLLRIDDSKSALSIEPPMFRAYVATNPDIVES